MGQKKSYWGSPYYSMARRISEYTGWLVSYQMISNSSIVVLPSRAPVLSNAYKMVGEPYKE